jgi:hypothetical protein
VYVQRDWLSYRWSAWMPLMAAHPLALAQLPSGQGLYRVRRADRRQELEWIGWAESGVRETVERLSRQVHLPVEPFDDPQSAACALWRLRRAQGASFEVSGALVPAPEREGWERERAARAAYAADHATREASTS